MKYFQLFNQSLGKQNSSCGTRSPPPLDLCETDRDENDSIEKRSFQKKVNLNKIKTSDSSVIKDDTFSAFADILLRVSSSL